MAGRMGRVAPARERGSLEGLACEGEGRMRAGSAEEAAGAGEGSRASSGGAARSSGREGAGGEWTLGPREAGGCRKGTPPAGSCGLG